jgi:hypothetical protein
LIPVAIRTRYYLYVLRTYCHNTISTFRPKPYKFHSNLIIPPPSMRRLK